MALKKPSDFFGNDKNNVKISESAKEILPESFDKYRSISENLGVLSDFTSSFGTLKENVKKINSLEESLLTLKEEIENSVKKEDLDSAMMSNLLVLEKSIQKIEFNLKGINRKDLKKIQEEVEDIGNKVSVVIEEEFPKYKKSLKSNEVFIRDKFFEYTSEIDEKLDNFDSFLHEAFDTIKSHLQTINENQLLEVKEEVLESSLKIEEQNKVISKIQSKSKNQIFGLEIKIKDFYDQVKESINAYQKENYNNFGNLESLISSLKEEEVIKYQNLLQDSKIKNENRIKKFEIELDEKYDILSNQFETLLQELNKKSEELNKKSEHFSEEYSKKVLELENNLNETSDSYKSLIKSIESKGLKENKKFELYENQLNDFDVKINELTEKLTHFQQDQKILEENQKDVDILRKEFFKKLNLIENDILHKEDKIKKTNENLLEQINNVSKQLTDLNLQNYRKLSNKIIKIEEIFEKFNEKTILNEGLLNEPPEVKNSDPLTPTNKNFVTLDQLQEHYRLFINRVQQQLATIGGGGETRLEFLDDVDRNTAKTDGYVLSYQESTGKFIGTSISAGSSSQWVTTSTGIHTTSNVGIGTSASPDYSLYVDGDAFFTGNVSVAGTVTYEDVTNVDSIGVITARSDVRISKDLFVSGISTLGASNGIGTVHIGLGSTALFVDGDARIIGILTVGRGSVTIDGQTNTITSGEVTITGSSITLGDNVTINAGATGINSAPNVLYVAKDGSDTNNGTSIDNAKLTIAGAVAIAQSGTTIKVLSGTYNENNPIEVPAFVSIVGDSLKTVTVIPNNSTQDIFHVNKGTYLSQMTFVGHVAPAAAVAFPPTIAENTGGGNWESPYVQNCTSNTTTGTGMRIDGSLAEGLKSMVVDAYTQYNQGGVGIAITNGGYAQLVSVFTICCNESITAHKGGQCSLTNSNTSFGTLGLVADGVSDLQYTGIASTAPIATNTVTVSISTTTKPYDGQVVYFGTLYQTIRSISVTNGGSGYTSTPTVSIASPTGPNGITATAFAVLNGDRVSEIVVVNSGTQYTDSPVITISAPDTGTTATASANMNPIYYTINSSTPIVAGITTITLEQNLNNTVSSGTTAYFYQLSRITASSHTFEYVGSGNDIATATPLRGGVPIQDNEIVELNGGRVIYTSTDQSGNFRIGNDIVINQNNGTITGRAFTRSLFNQMTPFILALS